MNLTYKKGQITLFVIVGIIIVLLVGVGVYYRFHSGKNSGTNVIAMSDEEYNVRMVVQECFEQTLDEGITLAQQQSGNVFLPRNVMNFEGVQIPYIYEEGLASIIKEQELEQELERYVDTNIQSCVNTTQATFEKPNSDVRLTETGVNARLSYLFSIMKEETTIRNTDPYTTTRTVPMKQFLALMQTIGEATLRDPSSIPIGLLINQKTFKTETVPLNDEVLYSLETEKNELYLFSVRIK